MTDSKELQNPGMFDGLTAWFSSSVHEEIKKIWQANDGDTAEGDIAMLVFSEDADTPDTESLYNSDAYLNGNLAIFHASYISECVKCGNTKQVAIGKYLLPPRLLYEKIKNSVKYGYNYNQGGSSRGCSNAKELRKLASNVAVTKYADYIDIDTLSAVTYPLEDFEVGRNGCHIFKA